MDSWASWVLLVAVALFGLDAALLVAFIAYSVLKWHSQTRRRKIGKEDEVIKYGDAVAIKTEKVPIVFDYSSEFNHADFVIPTARPTHESANCTPEEVQISMYASNQDGRDAGVRVNQEETTSKLSFSIHFDAVSEEMTVSLIRARLVRRRESDADESEMHVSVSVVLLPDGTIYHSSRGVPPNPLFKDKFTFKLNSEALQQCKLKFNVWMIDKYSRKKPFGESTVDLARFFKDQPITTTSIEKVWLGIERKDELVNETANGELLVSIQYLPRAENINITIMKGRDLDVEEFDKDVYVKVSSLVNGRIYKNKKTSSVKKTANPVFNEVTSFSLSSPSPLNLKDTVIILSAYAHRTRGPHKRLIGRCQIGLSQNESKLGKDHWQKMVDSPSRMIAEWLDLQ